MGALFLKTAPVTREHDPNEAGEHFLKDLHTLVQRSEYQEAPAALLPQHLAGMQAWFSRSTPVYFLLMATGSAISIGKNLVFAKVLSVDAFGYLALFNVMTTYGASSLHLGLLNGLNREFPVAIGQGGKDRAIYLRNMVCTALVYLLAAASILYSVAVLWAARDLQMRAVLMAVLLAASASIAYQLVALELRARQLLVPFSLICLIQGILTLGVGVLSGLRWGLNGVIAAVILGNVAVVAIAWTFWLDRFRLVRVQIQEIKYLLRIGVPLLLSTLCVGFMLSMDRLFVVKVFGVSELGQYQFAALITTAGQALAGIVGMWVVPKVLYDHGRGISPQRNFYRVLTIMGAIMGAFLIAWYPFVAVASSLVERFFPRYVSSVPLLNFFFLAAGFTTINLAGVILNALNRQRLLLAGTISVTVALFVSYFIASRSNASLVTFAKIFLWGQILTVGVNLGLASWGLRGELKTRIL